MRMRSRFITLIEADAGMVLASPICAVHQGVVRMTLPEGHRLTNASLQQLRTHEVDFLFVTEPDRRSSERVAVDTARAARHVMEIFENADLSNPTMANFFDQVLAYRSA